MAIGTNNITITTAANYIPELWLNEVIAAYKANNVMRNLVTVYNHNKKKGDTLHIPGFTRSLAATKAAGTAVAQTAPTHGVTNLSITEHYAYAKFMEDIVDVQAMSPLLRQAYMEDGGYAVAREIDYQLHVEATSWQGGTVDSTQGTPDANTLTYGTGSVIGSDGATAWSATGAGNGAALADAGVRRAMRDLDDVDVPLSNRAWVVPPVTRESLLGIPKFTENAFQGDGSPIKTGQIGKVYGDPVMISTECGTTTNTSGSTNFRAVLYFHKSAQALAEQLRPRAQTQYNLEFLGTLFVVDVLFGSTELRNDAGRVIIVAS